MATRHLGWSDALPRQTSSANGEHATPSVLAGLRHADVATALDDGLGVFDARGTSLECNDVLRRLLAAPAPTEKLLALGLLLVVAGGGLVARGLVYERRH